MGTGQCVLRTPQENVSSYGASDLSICPNEMLYSFRRWHGFILYLLVSRPNTFIKHHD